jgi:hypothetical protein
VALDLTRVKPDASCSDSSSITGHSELGLFGVKLTGSAHLVGVRQNPPLRPMTDTYAELHQIQFSEGALESR